MFRKLIDKFLRSTGRSKGKRYYSSSAKKYSRRYSSSHRAPRYRGSSSDQKYKHGKQGHGYYKSRKYSSS